MQANEFGPVRCVTATDTVVESNNKHINGVIGRELHFKHPYEGLT